MFLEIFYSLLQVIFSEPVVITACEFLEQNASSICPAVKLMGYGGYTCVHNFIWSGYSLIFEIVAFELCYENRYAPEQSSYGFY